jgi:hypothetical protein
VPRTLRRSTLHATPRSPRRQLVCSPLRPQRRCPLAATAARAASERRAEQRQEAAELEAPLVSCLVGEGSRGGGAWPLPAIEVEEQRRGAAAWRAERRGGTARGHRLHGSPEVGAEEGLCGSVGHQRGRPRRRRAGGRGAAPQAREDVAHRREGAGGCGKGVEEEREKIKK